MTREEDRTATIQPPPEEKRGASVAPAENREDETIDGSIIFTMKMEVSWTQD